MAEETQEKTQVNRKQRVGTVISDRCDKTIVVRVDRRVQHPLYKKVVIRSRKYHVHDEHNDARVGDRVRISETRPLSKMKRWELTEVQQRAVTD